MFSEPEGPWGHRDHSGLSFNFSRPKPKTIPESLNGLGIWGRLCGVPELDTGGGTSSGSAALPGGRLLHLCDWSYSVLGGSGDLGSRLIIGITGVTIWVMGVINLLTKSPLTLQVLRWA